MRRKMFHDTFLGLHHCRGMPLVKPSVLGTWWAGTKDGVPSKLPLLWTLIKLLFVLALRRARLTRLSVWKWRAGVALLLVSHEKSKSHRAKTSFSDLLLGYKPLRTSALRPVGSRATSRSLSGCPWNVMHRVHNSYREGDTFFFFLPISPITSVTTWGKSPGVTIVSHTAHGWTVHNSMRTGCGKIKC